MRTSRIPGFFKLSVEERRRVVAEAADLDAHELEAASPKGGLDVATSDKTVENVLVDCCDAMGANLVNSVAEAVGDRIAAVSRARVGFRILSNLCDRRKVRVTCRVPFDAVKTDDMAGADVARGIEEGSRFAELDA